jgi:hypothetical protein
LRGLVTREPRPVEVRLERRRIRRLGEVCGNLVEKRLALVVGKRCDVAPGSDPREQPLSVENGAVLDGLEAKLFERRLGERVAPGEGQIAMLRRNRIGEAVERLADSTRPLRRAEPSRRPVPQEDKAPTRLDDTSNLRDRTPPVEPMERFAAEHRCERIVGHRDLFRRAPNYLRLARKQRSHGGVGLYRGYARKALEKQPRKLAGARTEVEHPRLGTELQLALDDVKRSEGPRRPAELVLRGSATE